MDMNFYQVQRSRRIEHILAYYQRKLGSVDVDTLRDCLIHVICIMLEGATDEEIEKWERMVLLENTGKEEEKNA